MTLLEQLNTGIAAKAEMLTSLNEKRGALAEAEALYADLYGGDGAQELLKRFMPKIMKWGAIFGLPTGALATAADSGALSGIFNAIGKVLGLFGLG